MKISKRRNKGKKIAIITTIVVLACALVGLYWYISNKSSGESVPLTSNTQHKETIDSSAEDRVKNGGGSGQGEESASSGGVVDTGGKGVSTQSNGTHSPSGDLVLYSPAPGQNISDNITVKGMSKSSIVYYRIKDSIRGMIGSGYLSADNGYFSGTLSASTSATTGSFEVYNLDSNGREINNVSVKVAY